MLTAELDAGEEGIKDQPPLVPGTDQELEEAKRAVKDEYAEMGIMNLDRITLTSLALKRLGRTK